jgi:hypothetical protein
VSLEPVSEGPGAGASALAPTGGKGESLLDLLHQLDVDPETLATRLHARGQTAPTVEEAIAAYLEWAAVGKAPQTITTYRTGLRRFCQYLAFLGLPPGSTARRSCPPTLPRASSPPWPRRAGARQPFSSTRVP